MSRIGFWPDTDNSCPIKDCKGAGSQGHIKHKLAEMSIDQLKQSIDNHCFKGVSSVKSCLCYFYASELLKRGIRYKMK